MAVFEGSSTAYGQTKIGNQRRDGKTEAKSFIIKEPLREDLVQEHLEGLMGVGAIPINNENMCKFGVIDIDDYPISHSDIIKKRDRFNIHLVVCLIYIF